MDKRRLSRLVLLFMLLGLVLPQMFVFGAPTVLAASQGTYRALLIGNDAYKTNPLKGCINDAKAVQSALKASTSIKYGKIELKTNLTQSGIASAITALQSWGTKPEDVTLIYYSGHGYRNSANGATGIVGTDLSPYSFELMERSLNQLQGSVIILLDSCYSGGAIDKSAQVKLLQSKSKEDIYAYNQSIMDVFNKDRQAKSKSLTSSKYHVITAASGVELSYESGGYGYFTTGLTEAMGWNINKSRSQGMAGDQNADGILNLSEAYAHARQVVKDFGSKYDQNVQISPAGSTLALVGRGGSAVTQPDPQDAPAANGLPNLKTAILASGQMLRLNSSQPLVWKSSKSSVATVSETGLVVARKSGKTVITGTQGGKAVVKCTVGVMSASKVVRGVSLNASSVKKGIGSSYKLKAKIAPSSAYSKAVKWYSSDKSVATVSGSGVVKAKKIGTARIYCIASSGMLDSCTVEVTAATVTKVRQKKAKASVLEGKTLRMQAKALPAQAENRRLQWSSEDASVATVDADSGVVTGVAPGKVYITATSTDGTNKSARCLLTVKKNTFSRSKMVRAQGKLRAGAVSIRYNEDKTQLLIDIGYANMTDKERSIPKSGSKLYFRTGEGKKFKAISSVETNRTRLASGETHVITYKLALKGKYAQLAKLDLRKADAYVG